MTGGISFYVDEAGTSKPEPISVVAGIIIQRGSQARDVQREIVRLLDQYVPPRFRPGYIFHATQLFSGSLTREEWGDNRWKLLTEMTAIPQRFRLPASHALVRRGTFPTDVYGRMAAEPIRLSPHEFDHAIAFGQCIAAADKHLRKNFGTDGSANLIAENVVGMRRSLQNAVKAIRIHPQFLPPELIRQDVSDVTQETIERGEEIKIDRMLLETARFARKSDDPLLQLADAMAFAIRRWVTQLPRGDQLMIALRGELPRIEDFSGGMSWGTWTFHRRFKQT